MFRFQALSIRYKLTAILLPVAVVAVLLTTTALLILKPASWPATGLVLFGVLGVAALVATLAAGLASRPVTELVERLDAIVEGREGSDRLLSHEPDELGRLAGRVNDLLDRNAEREEELRLAREDAEQAHRAKSAFLANMSHELRTPLTAILGYSEILIEDSQEAGHDDSVPDLERIHAAGRQLLDLIDSILDLSKVEAGNMNLLPEQFAVEELLRDVAGTARPLIERSHNILELHLAENLGQALTDRTKVRQILLHLLSNAAKLTEAGLITLDARRTMDDGLERLVITVRDTGIGMTPDELERLFHAFIRNNTPTSRADGGTGLELALAKRYAEMMRGSIEVASLYGEGTTFTLTLPANVVRAKQREDAVRRRSGEGIPRDKLL